MSKKNPQKPKSSIPRTSPQKSQVSTPSSQHREASSTLDSKQKDSNSETDFPVSQDKKASSPKKESHPQLVHAQVNSTRTKNTETSQSKRVPNLAKSPNSVKELCEQLNQLVQEPKWKKDTAEKFINLIINNSDFIFNPEQKKSFADIIISCPQEYRAIVHLAIVSVNFTKPKGLRTVEDIIPQISNFISEELELEPRIGEMLLTPQKNPILIDWLKQNFNPKSTQQDSSVQPLTPLTRTKITPNKPNIDRNSRDAARKSDSTKNKTSARREEVSKKLELVRNLLTFLICNGSISAIDIHLNLILEAFADSNHFLKPTSELPNFNVDIQDRIKAVSEFFVLEKPTAAEAERLVLYACSAQILAKEQADEITKLKNRLQKEKELNNQREDSIQALKKQCEQFQNQLTETRQQLEQMQGELESERKLYERLNQSSQVEIIQERNAVLRKVGNRIEHELQILERCLNGSAESFQANSRIGLQNIEKIRKSLSLKEK